VKTQTYPILEFDPAAEAVIEPSKVVRPVKIPERCVLAFSRKVVDGLVQAGKARTVSSVETEMGDLPVYEVEVAGRSLAVMQPGITGPFVAGVLEELIAMGCRTFVACGGSGVLQKDIVRGAVVLVSAAVRDEGTSYHYLAPAREVAVDPEVLARAEAVLQEHRIKYIVGKTWTTDAIYRETPDLVARRRAEGCLTVEMEAASFLAVAQFRKVKFVPILNAGDDVSGEEWDRRLCSETATHFEKLFWLAAEICLSL
jgi:uridine phosphorylase